MNDEKPVDEGTAPSPDVPLSVSQPATGGAESPEIAEPAINEANKNMADKIFSGMSPYNFGVENKNNPEMDRMPAFSLANVTAVVSFIGLIFVMFIGLQAISDLGAKINMLATTVSDLSIQVADGRDQTRLTGKAITKSELKRTLLVLEQAEKLGDPRIAEEVAQLKAETETILADMAPAAPVNESAEETGGDTIEKIIEASESDGDK